MTKQQIFERFFQDLDHPNLEKALSKSFSQFNNLKNQLIDTYSDLTGIPKDEFHRAELNRRFESLPNMKGILANG